MILYEFEGKKLLENTGIKTPKSQLLSSLNEEITITAPFVLKAQVLSGKRADGGGIIVVESEQVTGDRLQQMFGKTINKEKVEKILVEEKVEYSGEEFYVSISYDTESRGPVLTVSQKGGTGIESREVKNYSIDPIDMTAPD